MIFFGEVTYPCEDVAGTIDTCSHMVFPNQVPPYGYQREGRREEALY